MEASRRNPEDIQVMASILQEVGADKYDPRVLDQLLEFNYRYVTSVMEIAKALALKAKTPLDVNDVKLAIKLHVDRNIKKMPPLELLMELSRHKNGAFMPLIKSAASDIGLRTNKKIQIPPTNLFIPDIPYEDDEETKNQRFANALAKKADAIAAALRTIRTSRNPRNVQFLEDDSCSPGSTSTTGNFSPSSSPVSASTTGNFSPSSSPVSASTTGNFSPSSSGRSSQGSIDTEPSDHGEKRKRDDDDSDMDCDL